MVWYWIIAVLLVAASAGLHAAGVIRFDPGLRWSAWLIAGLVLLNGGWMAFDGGRALIVGDYVTPKSGQLAGTLGPWSKVVGAVGVDPRSTLMKSALLVYGLAYLAATMAFLLGASGARWAVLLVAILGLWYVPFGTIINVAVIVLLLLPSLRTA